MKRKFPGAYSDDWSAVATAAKEAAGWKCVRCGHEHDRDSGHVLTIHHLDGDKSNNAWWNLAALCQRCHLHIQGKVIMERPYMFEHSEWFRPYVAGYYAAQHGHPDDRDWVLENIEALLEYGKPPFESSLERAK
jgi:hypothetical protein